MASRLIATTLRRAAAATKSALSAYGKRNLHISATKQGGHGESSGGLYSNEYLHAPHMYDIPNMKHKHLKMGILVFGGLFVGSAVPVVACRFQQKKAGAI